jgi:hypothetical protein
MSKGKRFSGKLHVLFKMLVLKIEFITFAVIYAF